MSKSLLINEGTRVVKVPLDKGGTRVVKVPLDKGGTRVVKVPLDKGGITVVKVPVDKGDLGGSKQDTFGQNDIFVMAFPRKIETGR